MGDMLTTAAQALLVVNVRTNILRTNIPVQASDFPMGLHAHVGARSCICQSSWLQLVPTVHSGLQAEVAATAAAMDSGQSLRTALQRRALLMVQIAAR